MTAPETAIRNIVAAAVSRARSLRLRKPSERQQEAQQIIDDASADILRLWEISDRVVVDDQIRCIVCGQIDEPDLHDNHACLGTETGVR